ncbi:MAG TPA: hypothetical protein VNA20_03910 [Frankiaceae bacterium]|nr:hypothetical protein [Frankiaceae bacterium]
MRFRLALACVLAATPLGVTAPASAAPCSTATRTISGTLIGEDGRFVDAMLGFDLMRIVGGKEQHLDGRAGSPNYGCPGYYGYGQILRVNRDVPATGSTTTGTRYWSVKIPASVTMVIIEVYPRAAGTGPVDDSRYSGALRWKVPIPYGKRINITLPRVCAAGGKTGYIAGKVTKNGAPVKVDFVGGWSMAKDNNTASPIMGFRVGDGYDNGVYKIRNLAANQYYTVYWIENGVRKQRYNIWVSACKGTPISVAY